MVTPYLPPVPPFLGGTGAFPRTVTFAYQEGEQLVGMVERLRKYLVESLAPFIDAGNDVIIEAFESQVNAVITDVNTALGVQSTTVSSALAAQLADVVSDLAANLAQSNSNATAARAYVDAAVASIINSTIAVTDPVLTAIDANAGSTFRIQQTARMAAAITTATAGKLGGLEVVTGAGGSTGPNLILGSATNRNGSEIAADVATSVLLNPGAGAGQNNVIGGDGALTVGTATPNATTPGTNASVSVVGGYDCVAGGLASKIISDHSYTKVGGTHGAIYGGANQVIGSAADFSGIFGGYGNIVDKDNSFATGRLNNINADNAFACGQSNTITGSSANAFGQSNIIDGAYGHVEGQINTVEVQAGFASARGQYGIARNYGLHITSAGKQVSNGDSQAGYGVQRTQTVDATANVKLRPNGAASPYWTLVRGEFAVIEATVVGKSADGLHMAAFKLRSAAHFPATTGASLVLGTPVVETLYTTAGTLAARINAVSSIGNFWVEVTGDAATVMNWTAKIEVTETVLI